MKVLVLTDLFPTPQNPNHGIFIYQWAFHLSKICDMTVYQVIFQEIEKPADRNETAHFGEIYPQNQPFVWIQRIKTISRFDRIWRRSRQFYRQVESDLAQSIGEFNIIIGQMGCPGGYTAVRLARKFEKKSIVGLRGSDVNAYLTRPVLKRFMRRTLNQADQLVTVSAAMKAELIRRGYPESKISVVYNGVDEALFHPLDLAESRKQLNLPQEKKILLFVGSLTITSKGIDLLLDAVQEITESNLMVYLIGTGEEKPQIEALIHQKQLSDKIILHEPVPHAKLNDWFNAADLLVLPSRREGVPNVILEAMATGTPVVASNVGGIPEIIIPEITGLLHRSGSVNDLKDKITDALNHSWDDQAISQSSQRFSWESNSQQYLQIVEKLLNFDR